MGMVNKYAEDAVTHVVERYLENKKNGITIYVVIPDGFNNRVFFGFLDMLRKENPKFQIDYDDVLIYDKAIAVLPKITSEDEEVIFFQLSITSTFQFNRMVHKIEETIGTIPEIVVGSIPKNDSGAIIYRYLNTIKNTSVVIPRNECIQSIDSASNDVSQIPYGIKISDKSIQSSAFVKVYGKCRNGEIYISPFPNITQPLAISSIIYSSSSYMDSMIIINDMTPNITELIYAEMCSTVEKLQIEEMMEYLSLSRTVAEKRLVILTLLKLMTISSFVVLPLKTGIEVTESWRIENGNIPKCAVIDFLRKIPKNISSEFLSILKRDPFYRNEHANLISFDLNRESSVYSEACFGMSLFTEIKELTRDTITAKSLALSDSIMCRYSTNDDMRENFERVYKIPSLFDYHGSLNEGFIFGVIIESIYCGYCNIEYDLNCKSHFILSYMSRAVFYPLLKILEPAIMIITKRKNDAWWANYKAELFINAFDEPDLLVYPFFTVPKKVFIKLMEYLYKDFEECIDRKSGEELTKITIRFDRDFYEMTPLRATYFKIAKDL